MASRADVAVSCSAPGTYELRNSVGGGLILTVEVSGTETTAPELPTFNPLRPSYLQSLLFYEGTMNTETVTLDDDEVNGQQFVSHDHYIFEIQQGEVQDWTIGGVLDDDEMEHPYHVHVNHFQIQCDGSGPDNWSNAGDWLDTMGFDGNIRFHTHTFGGHVVCSNFTN